MSATRAPGTPRLLARGPARSASRRPGQARRQNASPTCPGWPNTPPPPPPPPLPPTSPPPSPPATSVRTRLSAPFILSLRSASSACCKFLPCLSGCYPSTLSIECANWEISAAPTLPLDRQRERAKLLMVDFDLDVVGGAD